jgi:hypothetical protein
MRTWEIQLLAEGVAMEYDNYLRDRAEQYRQRAETTEDIQVKLELLALAVVCEEVATDYSDRLMGG